MALKKGALGVEYILQDISLMRLRWTPYGGSKSFYSDLLTTLFQPQKYLFFLSETGMEFATRRTFRAKRGDFWFGTGFASRRALP